MSQAGNFDISSVITPIQTLTGDAGGAVSPLAGNIDLLGGNNITTTGTPNTITIDVTGTTQYALQLGNATGSLDSLGVATNGQLPIGAGAAANPILATLTGGIGVSIVNGAGSITINAAGVDQITILYVGKHGNDANDGLTINKAFLTFGAAMAAAAPGDTIWCFDDGIYTENITGVNFITIHAPNAILSGTHTMANGSRWRFQELKVATATSGITFNSAGGGAGLFAERFTILGTGIGIINLAGGFFVEITRATLVNGFFLGNNTADQTHVTFGEINITGSGTAFGAITGGELHLNGTLVTDSGSGTLFFTAGGGTPEIDAVISHVHITELSDITAGSNVRLTTSFVDGTATEVGGGLVSIGGAQRIDNVPIGAVTPSTGDFTIITTTTPIDVAYGGTGIASPTDHSVLVGSGAGAMTELGSATNGQLIIGSTTADPVLAELVSTNGTIDITNGAGSIGIDVTAGLATATGFAAWDGAGPFFDDTVLGDFEVSESGTGYINGKLISWAAPQTETGLTAGNTYYIYIDNTGTIQKTTTLSQALIQNNILLFEVLRDSTAGTNIQTTVKENHPYDFQPAVSYWAHETVGVIIENHNNGANITLNGTQKIEINGADELSDHGLYTDIPDSGGTAEVFNQYFTLGSGKWARYIQSDTFDGTWDNAGTATAIGGNKYTVSRLYVSKDNINVATPVYFSVLGDAEYNNLTAAQTAIANGDAPAASGELAQLEIAQLGFIIFEESSTSIVDVIISKETLTSVIVLGGTNQASLVLTDTTNFDHILSVADTNVQSALETIDDLILRGDAASDAQATAAVFTIAGGIGASTTGAGSTMTINAAGVDQSNIIYIGKHGNDTNDGLTINKAFLTFGAALAAATPGDTVWCFDDGTYTENLTGVDTVSIYAPNATLSGVHTMVGDGRWVFYSLLVANAVTGITFDDFGAEAEIHASRMLMTGSGVGVVNLGGVLRLNVQWVSIDTGFLVGTGVPSASHTTFVDAVDVNLDGEGTLFSVVDTGKLHIVCESTSDNGLNVGTIFSTTGGGTPLINAVIAHMNIKNLSNITAGSDVRLTCSSIEGTALEIGAGLVTVGGAERIDNVPIGAVTPSTGDFTTITTTTPIDVVYGGTGVATLTTAYAVLCAGTTATSPVQSIASVGVATQVLTSNGAGALPTFQAAGGGGGISWSVITANQSIVVDEGYICNKAGVLALALPAAAVAGTVFRVTGMNTDLGWSVTQGANQQIHFGDLSTTSGAGGSLASTLKRDSIECVCVVADLEWNVISSVGNITVV